MTIIEFVLSISQDFPGGKTTKTTKAHADQTKTPTNAVKELYFQNYQTTHLYVTVHSQRQFQHNRKICRLKYIDLKTNWPT